jgi:hypothetical protein
MKLKQLTNHSAIKELNNLGHSIGKKVYIEKKTGLPNKFKIPKIHIPLKVRGIK